MSSPLNQLTFDSSSGTLYGNNDGDNSNQTQVIYELNRDLLLRRLETSSLILNELLSVLEEPKNNQMQDQSSYNTKIDINFDTLVNNDLIKLFNLDFKTSSKNQIITRSADEKYESWSLQSDNLKNFKDLEIADDTLTNTFISKLNDLGQHLDNLINRVINPNSKILVCGDLNSGKSSFVNKLLALTNEEGKCVTSPVDQLPLTSVFIEFRHVSFNDKYKKAEIHAVKKSNSNNDHIINVMEAYNSFEENTYDVYDLEELDTIINDEESKNKYGLLVVYVEENSEINKQHSILKNGVVDCSVIDSPGLNVDDFITNDIFSKQETIDLIIFVVNAENQLTLSGKDFIKAAKAEKSFIFFIVNKFDQIKNKEKCSNLIMDQIAELTPLTYKQHSEFVHCISSKPNDGDDNNGNEDDKKDPDFDKLREAIKNFVVLKKSKNKLEPAQTFLNNFLKDLYFLTDFNIKIYKSRIQIVSDMLTQIRPEIEKMSSANMDINKKIDYLIDEVVDTGYDFVREGITKSLDDVEIPEYKGLTSIHEYVLENIEYMKGKIDMSVISGENHAREITKNAVNTIYDYSSVPDSNRLIFDDKVMFSSKSDYSHSISGGSYNFTDGIEVFFQFQDLFEPSWDGFVNFLIAGNTMLDTDKQKDIGSITSTNYGFLGDIMAQMNKLAINPSLIFNSRIPTLALYSLGGSKIISNIVYYGSSFLSWNSIVNLTSTLAATGGCLVGAYLISDLPRALPYNLIKKYKEALNERDYPHTEAVRITKDIRKVLKIPQMELITKNNSKLFDIKEKEITWQSILKQLNSNLSFLTTYQDEVVQEQQRLMEVVLEID
ncbi:hypothetical protein ACO0OE_002852 [Hanseniaspora uvarum]